MRRRRTAAPTGMVSRASRVVAVTIAAGLFVGCTVPAEDEASRVPADNVPFQLLDPATSAASTTTPAAPEQTVKVYLVADDRLAIVNRVTTASDPQGVLALLALGPTESETASGLRTALVPDLATIVEVAGSLVTIDLDGEFSTLVPTEQRLALAQITFAMTQLEAILEVRFLVAGEPSSVPRGDGSSTDQPVTPVDYAEFAPG